jgi:hypothetical protein
LLPKESTAKQASCLAYYPMMSKSKEAQALALPLSP